MSSPSLPALQQLHRLDKYSFEFPDQLTDVLCEEKYQQCVPNLQGNDLVWLIEYLDIALDLLDPFSPAFRECLRELRTICSPSGTLPTSYALPSSLLNSAPEPFASGGYGDVYEGTLDGSRVCIKRIQAYLQDGPKKATTTFCQEAIMWRRLKHPNIVPLLGVTITPKFQLVSDWMSGGDLPEHLKKNPDADRLKLLSDVANGLCYLHSCNVIHADLKGQNILMDASGNARLVDFGLAVITENPDSGPSDTTQHGHTPRWAAPEVLDKGVSSKKADIFSFAMVMIEVFTGNYPFNNKTPHMATSYITQGKRPPRPTHLTFTENLWTLMQRCWNQDPCLRPEASEVLQALFMLKDPAWKHLIRHTLAVHDRISLITTIFSDHIQVERVGQLSGNDAQTFIDIIAEALDSLAPDIRRRCIRSLYTICNREVLLPRSLEIPLCYDPTGEPLYEGGFAQVWKGQYQSLQIAAKVLKVYAREDLTMVKKGFCKGVVTWSVLRHPNVLLLLGVTVTETQFVMVSEWMENGNIREFLKASIGADRLGLLGDVARGLTYMHDQGVVHGDLNGANILINHNGRACLAGFSLVKMVAGKSADIFSEGGTLRWMSPELLNPGLLGLENSHSTKESDCYALGMVILEVLSGRLPFALYENTPIIILKVMQGKRPERPRGDEGKPFTDTIWRLLELCWAHKPGDRPSAEAVLVCLEGGQSLRLPPDTSGAVELDNGQSDVPASDTGSTTTHSDSSPPAPPQNPPPPTIITTPDTHPSTTTPPRDHPPGVASSVVLPDNDEPPAPLREGSPKKGRIGRFARNTRKVFKAATSKLYGLRRAGLRYVGSIRRRRRDT